MSREQFRYTTDKQTGKLQILKLVDGEWIPWDGWDDRNKGKMDYSSQDVSGIRFKGINDNTQEGY